MALLRRPVAWEHLDIHQQWQHGGEGVGQQLEYPQTPKKPIPEAQQPNTSL